MGIAKLEEWLDSHRPAPIDLLRFARDARRLDGDEGISAALQAASTAPSRLRIPGADRVPPMLIILVDAYNFGITICCEIGIGGPTYRSHSLPSYDMLHQRIAFFHNQMKDRHIELRWYFDSAKIGAEKIDTVMGRRQQKVI